MSSRSGPGKSNKYRRWWFLPVLVFLLGICGLAGIFFRGRPSAPASPELEFLPVSLHSILAADYQANPNPALLPGVRLDLIWDAIYDREPDTTDLEVRKVALLDSLQTPVPFATSPVCQGTHVIYADQDTWVDSADPAAPHGSDLFLQVGRDDTNIKRILLFFPINNTLPQGVFIKNARLELDIESATGSITSDSIRFFNLTSPFSELTTTWRNQPEPDVAYRALNHTVASVDTRAWDITDIVQDWLLGNSPTAGLVMEPAVQTDLVAAYYSREADSQTNRQVSNFGGQHGPRLVINCGREPPTPEAVAALVSPTPTPVDSEPESPQPAPTIISTIRPTPSVATATAPSPQPTLSPPTPPASPANPTAPPPAPTTLPPPQPTNTSPPPPTNTPPDDNRDDDPEDRPVPSLAIDNVSIIEGDSGTVTATFQVTLSTASQNVVTVDYTFAEGTASLPADYNATGSTLTFPPGTTRRTITVQIQGDLLDEANETFVVNLNGAVNATLRDRQAIGTITDNDPAPALTIDDITLPEGNTGAVEAIFTVSLLTVSGRTVTVDYATANGTATAPNDYLATNGTLTFEAGTVSQTIMVTINGDALIEANETLFVNLSNAARASIADSQGTGTILNDDSLTISISDVTITEGDSGAADAVFAVNLSTASIAAVNVDYATANNTATAGSDYSATGGTLIFTPGVTTRNITVTVQSDTLDELDEIFFVNLSNPSSGTILDNQGLGTIQDDDDPPSLAIDDVTVTEGDSGTTDAVFTVSLDAASALTATVDVATANGTAFAGSDYTAITAQTLTFPPGVTVRTITVSVHGDPLDEPNETFFLNLSNESNATINDDQGLGTITDDDTAPTVDFDSSTYNVTESAATATITVTLSALSGQTVSVNYATADNSATAPADYATVAGSLTFLPGTTVQTFTVAINDDLLDEANETVTLDLSGPTNATIGGNDPATLTILDDDAAPSLSIDDVTVTEGDSGTTDAVFTVTLSQVSGQTVTVEYATIDDTATSPDDFTAISTTPVTFLPGSTTQSITITIQSDTVDETTETFFVNLSNPSSATIPDPQGLGTILDDDNPTLAINDVTVTEGDSGIVSAVFTVTLSASGVETATVNFATADSTAAAGSDYISSSGTLTFPAGVTQQALSIQVQGDTFAEPDETFFVNLSSSLNATIADGQGLGTIVDNDGGASLCSSPSITLTATADTYLRQNQPDMNYGSDVDLRTRPVTANPRTALIQFDSGSVPPNSVITCAALLLTQTSAPNTGQSINIRRVINSWEESQATWAERVSGTLWDNPLGGGDYITSTIEATFVPSTTNHAMNVTSLAQFWLDNSTSNFGLLMEAQNAGSTGEVQFASREVVTPTLRPRLAIEYIPTLSINDVSITEGDSGNTEAVFTVTLSTGSAQTVTAAYTTADGTATTSNNDYLPTSSTLTFVPGVTTQTITVTVVGDVIPEGTENFFVNLSSPTNAAIADGQGIGTILQDVGGLALPRAVKPIYLPLIVR